MANTKISQLTANTNPTGNEELVYAYNNTNGKMTVNTMKTFIGTGKQDTLVSGTNIKTINNTSLLGSGNITISGGGGGAGYDCVVDTAGTGDYTTLSAALTAGETSIFIKNGTYSETDNITITTPSVVIKGESEDGVIINIEKTTGDNLGYIIFDATGYSSDVTAKIENLTLNFVIGTTSSVVMVQANDKRLTRNIDINNCYINILTKVSNAYIVTSRYEYGPYGTGNNALASVIDTYNNCTFNVSAHSSVTPADVSCRFVIGEGTGRGIINSFNNCQFNMEKTGRMRMYIGGNCDSCNFWIEGDDSNYLAFMNIGGIVKGCYFDCSGLCKRMISGKMESCTLAGYGSGPTDSMSTALKDAFDNGTIDYWATSTSYSVGDFVIDTTSDSLLYCTEAHTSSTIIDYNKFEEYLGFTNITRSAQIVNSYLAFGQDNIISSAKLSNNTIEVRGGNIYTLMGAVISGNYFVTTTTDRTFDMYTFDNCLLSSNNLNFGTAGNVEAIGHNNILVNNILNAYAVGTPTITVAAASNNILDNNVISNNTH